ncbi:S-layer homology domain-containing protein [Roseofilum casamattae]|uniref:S-layer homology domain-containing protein n=1 Tax=Roseofilum casamattae BLCC-M143 TaxID=3022442 RepID=A0ABT7BWE5_9CYAN|nr:S-layer homology domain-containing protein [Roseofilum casamattae]MDJ1182781.1 S-layer homology domain-containing protein [Roseofilum casamattae BLCC-M143]
MNPFSIIPTVAIASLLLCSSALALPPSPVPHLSQINVPASMALEGTSWHWISWTEGERTERPQAQRPITLKLEKGTASGFGGCNSFVSEYQRHGEVLNISASFNRTFKFCGQLSEQEDWLLARLGRVQHYQISAAGELELFYGQENTSAVGTLRFRAEQELSQNAPSFTDVPPGYWAREAISSVVERGIMSGWGSGQFRPEATLTRAEFAGILQKAFQLPQSSSRPRFDDVARDFWAYDAITYATSTVPRLMIGYPEQRFHPEQPIARVEALVALAGLLRAADPESIAATVMQYHDRDRIPDYALEKLAIATQEQIAIAWPDSNPLDPNRPATKAEIAALVHHVSLQTIEPSQ